MSIHAVTAVKLYSEATGTAKLVQMFIAEEIFDGDEGIAKPIQADLAKWAGTTERSIRRVVAELTRRGELVIIPRADHRNVYAIPLYAGEEGYEEPVPCTATDHVCNGHHAPAFVNRTKILKEAGEVRRERIIKRRNIQQTDETRPRDEKPHANTTNARPTAGRRPTQPARPAEPDALPGPVHLPAPPLADFDPGPYPGSDIPQPWHVVAGVTKPRPHTGRGTADTRRPQRPATHHH